MGRGHIDPKEFTYEDAEPDRSRHGFRWFARRARWQQNGDEIATFLSAANPYWPKAALADMMKMHLSTTTAEVVARLNGKWDDDVAAFDLVSAHIRTMADSLSEGIIKQFPARFQ